MIITKKMRLSVILFLLPALQSIRFYDKMEQLHAENDFLVIKSCMFGNY